MTFAKIALSDVDYAVTQIPFGRSSRPLLNGAFAGNSLKTKRVVDRTFRTTHYFTHIEEQAV